MFCIVLASGAWFGMAALAALQHVGLDFGSIHDDLIVDHAPKARSVVAWWAWCLVPIAAFLVGPLSAALTRTLVANWWLLRGPMLGATAAVVLGLAAVGTLRPAPSTLAFTTNAVLGLLVVAGSSLLAWFGARILGEVREKATPAQLRTASSRTSSPLPVASLPLGGGSTKCGLPLRRLRRRYALAPGYWSIGRPAVLALLATVLVATVSVVGSASVLLDTVAPGAVRELAASWLPAGAASRARPLVLALLPTEPPRPVVMPPVTLLDAPPPKPVEPPVPRQRAISASVGYGGAVSESELTFAKGYSRRRAAQLAANMTSLPSIPQLTASININKIRAASLRFAQADHRINRSAADYRYVADNRSYGDDRRFADGPRRASKHVRGHGRTVDRQAQYADYYADYYNVHDRRSRHDHHYRGRERYYGYGDGSFARADPQYRRF